MAEIQSWGKCVGTRGKRIIEEEDLANYADQKENTNPLIIQERGSLNKSGSFGLQLVDCFRLKANIWW